MIELGDRDSDPELQALDQQEERRLEALLRNAFAPPEIDAARHERLLQAALEDPFAPASAEELVESERLRQALDEPFAQHEDARLARALSAAFAPSSAPPRLEPTLPVHAAPKRAGRVIYARFAGVGAALALAAAVLLRVLPVGRESAPAPDLAVLALAQSRSTAALFQVNSAGAPSERIDRIASARSRDLRDNRYALWGVR